MNIIQQPDSLSLSLNLKDFIIYSDSQISFVLHYGTEEIISQGYKPSTNGFITIRLRDIIHERLFFQFKDTGLIYEQSQLVGDFTAVINESMEVTFRVIRAGVDLFTDNATNFLMLNFLTWQPSSKAVTYYSPEFLTYYAPVTCKAKLKAYFSDNATPESKEIDLADFVKGKAYTIPLQYAVVAGLLEHRLPSYYDVWIENTSGHQLTYVQRYYATDMFSEQEDWVLFENSLGGLDTFRAYGSTNFNGEYTHNIAEIEDTSIEYRIDVKHKYKKNTGYLNKEERRWLLDFFPSKSKYIYVGAFIRPIVVSESNVEFVDKELPSNYTFTYQYADARPLLNLPRTQVPVEVLNITVPDVGSFTVPPRLAEFPIVPLSEGALFPIQNPYSEEWGTTTAAAIGNFIISLLELNGSGGSGGIGHKHHNMDLLDLLSAVNEYLLIGNRKVKTGYADEAGISRRLETKDFSQGTKGSGLFQDEDGNWHFEVDYGHFRRKFTAEELEIQKNSHIGGKQTQTAAQMICSRVEETEAYYRCFFQRKDAEGRTVYNTWKVNDQGIVETFNLQKQADGKIGNHFLWRLVVGISDDTVDTVEGYIDLSKTVCAAGSDAPLAGDEIVQLGYRGDDDPDRQTAIIQAGAGEGAPYNRQYTGINSFTLPEPETQLKPGDNIFSGKVHMSPGSSGFENFTDVEFGKINLIRNSGFTGDYNSAKLEDATEVTDETELYNQSIKWWAATNVTINYEDSESATGHSATLTTGVIMQTLYYRLMEGERYILSFLAKGASVSISVGGLEQTQELKPQYDRYVFHFTAVPDTEITFSGSCTITEIQLERGTVLSVWSLSPLDNNSFETKFEALKYLTDAIREGSSTFIGGLGLLSMILVGNYTDGELKKVTGGFSGVYNDDDDPLLWGSGDLEKAIRTISKCKDDPMAFLNMSDNELSEYVKTVLTHGGRTVLSDAIVRGYLYAIDGYFKGTVDMGDGVTHFDKDGSGWIGKAGDMYFAKWDKLLNWSLCAGNISWDNVNKVLDIAGKFNAKLGSKIGNLTINENGAMSGGNAVFEKVGYLWVPVVGGGQESIDAQVRKTIINQIGKSTTILLKMNMGLENYTYTIDLPTRDELNTQGISDCGFKITLIAADSRIYPDISGIGEINLNPTFRISSRPREKVSINFQERERPTGEMHDNNDNLIEYLDMAAGDVLELYYYNGVYYLLNRRN